MNGLSSSRVLWTCAGGVRRAQAVLALPAVPSKPHLDRSALNLLGCTRTVILTQLSFHYDVPAYHNINSFRCLHTSPRVETTDGLAE